MDKESFAELLRQGRAATQIDKARAEAFGSLVKTEGWRLYTELIDARVQSFSDVLLQPLETMDHVGRQEFVKGAMFAFVLLRDLPANTIAAMSQESDDED